MNALVWVGARAGALLLSTFLFSPVSADTWNQAFLATGTVSTFPYADRGKALTCTAVHLGGRVVLTAGHCFLGALDCLSASVVFNGDAKRPFPRKALCQKMIAVNAALFRSGAPAEDFALFEVDNAPEAFVSIADSPTDVGEDVRLHGPEGLLGSKNDMRGRAPLICEGVASAPFDPFGRPRKGTVFETRCPHTGFSHGAPLLSFLPMKPGTGDSSNASIAQLVGIVKGSYLPSTGRGAMTVFQEVSSAVSAALKDSFRKVPWFTTHTVPQRVTAGSFSSDAFPYALDGNLDFSLVTLPLRGTYTLAVNQGALTEITVIDGSGRSTHFKGAPSFASAAPRSYEGPLRVRVVTPKEAKSVHADIVLHEAPEGVSIVP